MLLLLLLSIIIIIIIMPLTVGALGTVSDILDKRIKEIGLPLGRGKIIRKVLSNSWLAGIMCNPLSTQAVPGLRSDPSQWGMVTTTITPSLKLTAQSALHIGKTVNQIKADQWLWLQGKTGVPGEKPHEAEKRTNKFNPLMTSNPGTDPAARVTLVQG